MKDIEVGEYMRTKEGEIHKVIKIIEDDGDWDYYCCGNNVGYFAMDIANHSKQLIDLIEDKDIVEIELSEEFVEKKDKKKLIQIGDIYTKETLQKDIDNGIITRILTILPYNQYMANCYKVGGENE